MVLGALLSQGRGGAERADLLPVTVPSDLSARMVRTKQAACLGTGRASPVTSLPLGWELSGMLPPEPGLRGEDNLGGEPRPGRVVSWWHRKAPAWEQGCAGSKRCLAEWCWPRGLGAQCMLSLADVRVLRRFGNGKLALHIARVTWLCWPEASPGCWVRAPQVRACQDRVPAQALYEDSDFCLLREPWSSASL